MDSIISEKFIVELEQGLARLKSDIISVQREALRIVLNRVRELEMVADRRARQIVRMQGLAREINDDF